jgi:hypothetical protein
VHSLQKSVTYKLNEWKNKQWSNTLESLENDKEGDASSTSSPLLQVPGGKALSDPEKLQALTDSLAWFPS